MSFLPFNRQQATFILLIFTLGGRNLQEPLKKATARFDPQSFSKDLHRLVDMLDRIENLSRLPLSQDQLQLPTNVDTSQLSEMASTFMNLLSSSEK